MQYLQSCVNELIIHKDAIHMAIQHKVVWGEGNNYTGTMFLYAF